MHPSPLLRSIAFSLLFAALASSARAECNMDITLNSQAAVDAFNCTAVVGSLMIQGGDITNLDALSTLTSVSESLRMTSSSSLVDVSGLSALQSVGGVLEFLGNDALPEIHLPALETVGEILRLVILPSLTSLDLPSLRSVGDDLRIQATDLTSLDGLLSLTEFTTDSATLLIRDNPSLVNIDGLLGIDTVPGQLVIEDNPLLEDLDGLGKLRFANTTFNATTFRIRDNLALDDFCGVWGLFDNDGLSANSVVTIIGNLANPTEAQILADGPCDKTSPISSVVATSEWNGGVTDGRVANLIDGSGLSGAGDVQDQVHDNPGDASTMWHAGPQDAGLGGPTGAPPTVDTQAVVFDLGATEAINRLWIWNHNQSANTGRGFDQYEVLVSQDSDPVTATYTSLGTFSLDQASGVALEAAQERHVPLSIARLVRLEPIDTHSAAAMEYVGLSEVRIGLSFSDCGVRRWAFDEAAGAAPDGTIVPESNCGYDGVVRGSGANFTNQGIDLPGGSGVSGNAYVDLPDGIVSTLEAATFEAWYELDTGGFFARVFDFGTTAGAAGADYLFYSATVGTDPDAQRVQLNAAGSISGTDMAVSTPLQGLNHVAVTFRYNGGGTAGLHELTVYREGVEVAQFTTTTSLANIDDVNAWLGRSNFLGDDLLDGEIVEFRLHDWALRPAQILASRNVGPGYTPVLPISGVAPLALGALLAAAAHRRLRNRGERH